PEKRRTPSGGCGVCCAGGCCGTRPASGRWRRPAPLAHPVPMLTLDRRHVAPFVSDAALADLAPRVRAAHRTLLDGSGAGGAATGWRTMLLDPNDALLEDLQTTAEEIRQRADVLLCIGIGGSYLGAEAVIQALTPSLGRPDGPEVLFAGHHLSPRYHAELL